jgi:hypothetical protein
MRFCEICGEKIKNVNHPVCNNCYSANRKDIKNCSICDQHYYIHSFNTIDASDVITHMPKMLSMINEIQSLRRQEFTESMVNQLEERYSDVYQIMITKHTWGLSHFDRTIIKAFLGFYARLDETADKFNYYLDAFKQKDTELEKKVKESTGIANVVVEEEVKKIEKYEVKVDEESSTIIINVRDVSYFNDRKGIEERFIYPETRIVCQSCDSVFSAHFDECPKCGYSRFSLRRA